MTTFFVMSAHHRRLVTFTFVFAQSLFWCGSAPAAIVLDEFNDPVMVRSPESNKQWSVTNDVGPLRAARHIRIGWGQGNPDGQLDASISLPSTLTGQVWHLNPHNQLSKPIVSMQFDYFFSPTDLSEGGVNDTFFLDFRRLESSIPPSLLLILVNGTAHLDGPLQRSSGPFTMAIPFTSFSSRDGTYGPPDYSNIQEIRFEIRASAYTGGGPDPLNFFMQLDRIRIGRAVPEPSTFIFGALASCFTCLAFRRHRRLTPPPLYWLW